MAPWFSNNESSDRPAVGEAGPALVIRTLKDDLEIIRKGGDEASHAQESMSPRQQKPAKGTAVSVGSPFGGRETSNKQGKGTQEKDIEKQRSPFGVAPAIGSRSVAPIAESVHLSNGLTPLVRSGELLSNVSAPKSHLVAIIAGIILFTLVGGAAYYYFGDMSDTGILGDYFNGGTSEEPVEITDAPAEINEIYSTDKPNYLSLDTEIVSSADIQSIFLHVAAQIREAYIFQPVEFMVTDLNNNPLAFSRFAFLMNLELPAELIALADESFSLYAFNDGGKVFLGLNLSFNDMQKARAMVKAIEGELPYDLRALNLNPNILVGKKMIFQSTEYNQYPIRFANIDMNGLSLDYTVRDNHIIIGTSKNTLRAIIDTQLK